MTSPQALTHQYEKNRNILSLPCVCTELIAHCKADWKIIRISGEYSTQNSAAATQTRRSRWNHGVTSVPVPQSLFHVPGYTREPWTKQHLTCERRTKAGKWRESVALWYTYGIPILAATEWMSLGVHVYGVVVVSGVVVVVRAVVYSRSSLYIVPHGSQHSHYIFGTETHFTATRKRKRIYECQSSDGKSIRMAVNCVVPWVCVGCQLSVRPSR